MTPSQAAFSFTAAALAATIPLDTLFILSRLVRRSERRPFSRLVIGMSRIVGKALLMVCVPGAIVALVAIYLRSWDDGVQLKVLLGLSIFGTMIGAFMAADLDGASDLEVVRQPPRTSLKA